MTLDAEACNQACEVVRRSAGPFFCLGGFLKPATKRAKCAGESRYDPCPVNTFGKARRTAHPGQPLGRNPLPAMRPAIPLAFPAARWLRQHGERCATAPVDALAFAAASTGAVGHDEGPMRHPLTTPCIPCCLVAYFAVCNGCATGIGLVFTLPPWVAGPGAPCNEHSTNPAKQTPRPEWPAGFFVSAQEP